MKITRRAALLASAGLGALLAGCQSQQADQEDTQNMTDRTPRHFDDDGNLTSPVDNDSVNTEQTSIGGDGPATGIADSALDENGRLVGGSVDGLTNPLTENLNADGYDLTNIGTTDADVARTNDLPVVEVDAFGATGDGTTDDYQAIQDAVDSVPDGERRALGFSAGHNYLISDTITVPADAIGEIVARNATVTVDADVPAISMEGSKTVDSASPSRSENQTVSEEESQPLIRDINVTSTGYIGTGISVSGCFKATIQNCHLYGLRDGITLSDVNRNPIIANNHIWDVAGYGVYFATDGNTHQVNLVNNHISYAEKCIYSDNHELANLQCVGNDIEQSDSQQTTASHLMHFEGSRLWVAEFTGNTFEGHGESDALLYLDGQADDVTIGENLFASATTAIRANGSTWVRQFNVDGAIIRNVDTGVYATSNVTDVSVSDTTFLACTTGVDIDDTGDGIDASVDDNDFEDVETCVRMRGEFAPPSVQDNKARVGCGALVDIETLNETSILGGEVTGNHGRASSVPAIKVDSSWRMRSVNVTDNNIYYDEAISDSGYAISISSYAGMTNVKADAQIHAQGGSFDGLQVSGDNYTGVVIGDSIISDLDSNSTAYDVPASDSGNVVVRETLNV